MLDKFSAAFRMLMIATAIISSQAQAAIVTGNLLMTPDNSITVTTGVIDFSNPFSATGTGSGAFTVLNGSTGTFGPLQGTQGTINDINNGNVPGGSNSHTVPVNVPVNFLNWMTLPIPLNNIVFDLTLLLPGIFSSAGCSTDPSTAAAGQTCTPNVPGGSPFNLLNLSSTSSQVSFVVRGKAYDTTTPLEISDFVGTFSTTSSNKPFQQVLLEFQQNGFVQSSAQGNFAMTFTPTPFSFVPEPSTLSTFVSGIGLILASALLRRRRNKS